MCIVLGHRYLDVSYIKDVLDIIAVVFNKGGGGKGLRNVCNAVCIYTMPQQNIRIHISSEQQWKSEIIYNSG
jgi:hypothetical protein